MALTVNLKVLFNIQALLTVCGFSSFTTFPIDSICEMSQIETLHLGSDIRLNMPIFPVKRNKEAISCS